MRERPGAGWRRISAVGCAARSLTGVALVVGVALALAPAGGVARAAAMDLKIGAVAYEGEFGSDDKTRVWAVPFELSLNRSTSRFTITVPYVGIDNVGNLTWTADGPLVLGVRGPGKPAYQVAAPGVSRRGLGDIVLSQETYLIHPGKGKTPLIGLLLDYKWATADEKQGLGTGKGDYSAGLEYLQPLGKIFQISAKGAYRWMGDPQGIDLKDGIKYSGGFAFVTNREVWRFQYEKVPAFLEKAPIFNAAGTPIGIEEVRDRESVRVDLIVRKKAGGTTRLGVSHGLNRNSEQLGLMLILSSGEQ